MPRPALTAAVAALSAALVVLRARTPGTPAGDADDPHEDNTFDLPNGNPIRRAFKRFARRQLKKILGQVPEIGAPIPAHFSPLAPDWTDPMASAMTPLITAYWDEAGKTTRARLGLDPDAWEVHDPHLHQAIQAQALQFCQETNGTTDLELGEALDKLREELAAGLVEHGETIPELVDRVKKVFRRLSDYRAEMIARTEASRAVHAASQMSAAESGVVQGKRWLASANSCDRCLDVAKQVNESHPKGVPLDQPFASGQSKNEAYSSVPHPPLHPHCRCSVCYVLTDEYQELLAQHGPPDPTGFQPGALGPDPAEKPKRERKPRPRPTPAPVPQPPAPPPWTVGTPIEPTRPIGERIAGAPHLEEKRQAVLELPKALHARIHELESQKTLAQMEAADFTNRMHAQGVRDPAELLRLGLAAIAAKHDQAVDELAKARADIGQQVRSGLAAILDLDTADRGAWKHADGNGFKGKTRNRETRVGVLEWLEPKAAAGGHAAPIEVEWQSRPKVRAYASRGKKLVMFAADESPGTMVHELGHHLEYRLPGTQKAAHDFLDHRCKNQPFESLRKRFGRQFDSTEKGRDDDFGKVLSGPSAWYVGKIYLSGSTEVISMGVELLYNDPVHFAEKDPEYFKFILGVLDGSMRTP